MQVRRKKNTDTAFTQHKHGLKLADEDISEGHVKLHADTR